MEDFTWKLTGLGGGSDYIITMNECNDDTAWVGQCIKYEGGAEGVLVGFDKVLEDVADTFDMDEAEAEAWIDRALNMRLAFERDLLDLFDEGYASELEIQASELENDDEGQY